MAEQGVIGTPLPGQPAMSIIADLSVATPDRGKNTMQMNTADKSGSQYSNNEGRLASYSASTIAFVPNTGAGGTTDVCGIVGAANKVIKVKRFAVSGRATAANQLDAQLVKRSTADTAGSSTAVNLTAVPHDSLDPAAGAVVTTYTGSNVNPNLGTAVGNIRAQQSNVSAAGSGGAATPVEWDFGNAAEKPIYLRSASEGLYLNFNGAVLPAGAVFNIFVAWTEENSNT